MENIVLFTSTLSLSEEFGVPLLPEVVSFWVPDLVTGGSDNLCGGVASTFRGCVAIY